ncbi:Succinate dehydrogenase cytochrome b560 subunit, mitochondrial [Papilio machaon]|uniref:Succinate dehydrogenase cytochrome b560 subunit, mitochondrial n=1 Tax=Papilio machaon TaxID=76193 RepID=A0A194QXS3_PAPMA|nr:Succinate dehydrogenase cytochrome b560 subunit, mitochondrial [Papilio machaon]
MHQNLALQGSLIKNGETDLDEIWHRCVQSLFSLEGWPLTWTLLILKYTKLLFYQTTPCLQLVTSFASVPCGKKGGGDGGGGKHTVTYKPYTPPQYKPHDKKNMDLNRPMSPHLTIYAPTLPAMTSIAQRITGVIVLSYAILVAFGSLFLPNGIDSYVSMIQSLDMGTFTIILLKMILGAPFAYHYFNGIRYCAWNAGKWLAMKDVYETARKSFILTAVFTVLFSLF